MQKKGLGKGLTALIPDLPDAEEPGVKEVDMWDIAPNKNQPRRNFKKEELEQLAQSIKQHGVVQPVVLRVFSRGYQIVAGERRWRAAKIAGLKTIPAVIKEVDDRQAMEMALIENLQREDLNPLEEAQAYKMLMERHGLTQEEISAAVGKSRSAVANLLRLLNLPQQIQQMLSEEVITAGHARAIIPLPEENMQNIAQKITNEGLNVRETEKLVENICKSKGKRKQKTKKDKESWALETESLLEEILGTRVKIMQGKKKGKIEIEYYTNEGLERIIEAIKN